MLMKITDECSQEKYSPVDMGKESTRREGIRLYCSWLKIDTWRKDLKTNNFSETQEGKL